MKRTALSVTISLLLLGTTPYDALALYVEDQPASDTQPSGDASQPATQPSTGASTQPTASQPSSGETSQPVVQPSAGGTSPPATEPVSSDTTPPATKPSVSGSTQPTTQPGSDETTPPVTKPSVNGNTQPTTQPGSDETTPPATKPSVSGSTQPATQPDSDETTPPATKPSVSGSTPPATKPTSGGTAQPATKPSAGGSTPPATKPSAGGSTQPVSQPTTAGGTSQPATPSSPNAQPCGQPSPCGQTAQSGQNQQGEGGQSSTCGKNSQGKQPSRPCNKQQRPKLQDFGIVPEQIDRLNQLATEVLQAFGAHQMGRVPAKAFKEMTAQQMMELPKEAISGLTPEQFQEMPPEALQGLTADNMAGLSAAVIGKFKPKHFAKLNHQQFQQMPGKGIGKLLTQCDSMQVKPEDVKDLLPTNWKLNSDDGTLQAPAGTPLALPTKQVAQQSSQVKMPQDIPDFGKGFGVGGRHPAGHSVLTGLNQGLAQAGYPQFTVQQSDQGILTVKGGAELQGTDLTFIPGKDMTQADETTTAGLSSDNSGQYVVTTPEKQQFPVVPAPKDPAAMSEAMEGQGTVEVGQEGDVLLKDTAKNQTVVGICDPIVTSAPANAKPGLHVTQQQNGKQVAQFVYKDGTMQTIHPTVLQPARFIEQTMATFDGVEKVVHRKDDGSFDVTVKGQMWSVTPKFEVTEEALPDNEEADAVEPQVGVCAQQPSCLTYTVPHDDKLLTMKLQVSLPQNGQPQPTTTQPTTPTTAAETTTEATVAPATTEATVTPVTTTTTVAPATTQADHSGGAPCSSCHGN